MFLCYKLSICLKYRLSAKITIEIVGNRITPIFRYKSEVVSSAVLPRIKPSPIPASKPKIGKRISNSFKVDLILVLFECETAVSKFDSFQEKHKSTKIYMTSH